MPGCMMPISSPMMNMMLGFCCCCADAGTLASERAAAPANKPSQSFREAFMAKVLVEWPLSHARCDDKSGEAALNLIQIKDLEKASRLAVRACSHRLGRRGLRSAHQSRTSEG